MTLKDLSSVVLEALDLHANSTPQTPSFGASSRRLVVGSGNALPTGRILFEGEDTLFCDEGQYQATLDREPEIDSVVVISASGTKHAPIIIRDLLDRGLPTYLITCADTSPAVDLLPQDHIVVTRSNPEPITYNTSTYMGMMLTRTQENTSSIKQHMLTNVAPKIPDFDKFEAFYLIVKPEFEIEMEMFITKFDELFGGRVNGRCYTPEQTLHAKTVVPWEKELFISFGYDNRSFGSQRLDIPLPENCGYVAMMAIAYYVIGCIQTQKPPWFIENAQEYVRRQKELFNET